MSDDNRTTVASDEDATPITLLIPMRDLHDAKSRLTCLDDGERIALARRCFEQTLRASTTATGFRPLIISNSPRIATLAAAFDVETVSESGNANGFRSLLRHAVTEAVSTASFGILMGDLPYVTAADLSIARRRLNHVSVVLAPDRHGLGTNLLLSRIVVPELLRFGAQDSFLQHLDAFSETGIDIHIVKLFGLAFDVDTADDLRAMSMR